MHEVSLPVVNVEGNCLQTVYLAIRLKGRQLKELDLSVPEITWFTQIN